MRSLLIHGLLAAALVAGCSAEGGGDGRLAQLNAGLPRVGEPLPAVSAHTLDGRRVDNASLHGRTVLLNLWFFH